MDREYLAKFFLRTGLAVVFLYAAIAAFLDPTTWIGYLPTVFRAPIVLMVFSSCEIILALWLFSNKKVHAAAIISAVLMAAIVIANLAVLDVVFRDIAIFLAALALVVLSKEKKRKR